MKQSHTHTDPNRVRRYQASPEHLLLGLPRESPMVIQTHNHMVSLYGMISLHTAAVVAPERCLIFPEDGLHVIPGKIDQIHGAKFAAEGASIASIEVAIDGEPDALLFATVPNICNGANFHCFMEMERASILSAAAYHEWREFYTRKPHLCPCCEETARLRRLNPQLCPLVNVMQEAADAALELRCTLTAPAYGYTCELTPAHISFHEGCIQVEGREAGSMLQIDPGTLHCMRITAELPDGEKWTFMKLSDNHGTECATIAAPGWDIAAVWRKILLANAR